MSRYTLQTADNPPVVLFRGDSVAECRSVAKMREGRYGNERAVLVRQRDGWIDELDGYGFCDPREPAVTLETQGPVDIQAAIQDSPEATRRVLRYLDARGIAHSGQISGATLASVCGRNVRSWRKWVAGEREFPAEAARLLVTVAFGCR
jgi:hypothetical protein